MSSEPKLLIPDAVWTVIPECIVCLVCNKKFRTYAEFVAHWKTRHV